MDDDNADWFSSADDPAPEPAAAETAAAPAAAGAAEGGDAPAAGGDAPGEESAPQAAEAEGDDYLDPDKLLLFKHWIRSVSTLTCKSSIDILTLLEMQLWGKRFS